MPSMIASRIANIATPSNTATTSMRTLFPVRHHSGITICGVCITISLRRSGWWPHHERLLNALGCHTLTLTLDVS